MALKIGIILLLLILVLLTFLLSSTTEGFQASPAYDRDANLEDLRYLMGLGLRPEYNDSYRDQLALYAANNNGADFRTSADAVGYRTRPPAQPSSPNANTSGGASGVSDQNIRDILNVANSSKSKIDDIDNRVVELNQRTLNNATLTNYKLDNTDSKLNNINNRLSDFDTSVSDKLADINSKVIIADGKVANIGGYMQDIFNRVNNTNDRINSIYDSRIPPSSAPSSQTQGPPGFPPSLTTLLRTLTQTNPQLALELNQIFSPASTGGPFFIEDYNTFMLANPNPTVSQSETFARDWLTANRNLLIELTQAQSIVLAEFFSTNPVLQQQFQQRFLTDRRLAIDIANFIRTNPNFTANQFRTFLINWLAANPSATSQASTNNQTNSATATTTPTNTTAATTTPTDTAAATTTPTNTTAATTTPTDTAAATTTPTTTATTTATPTATTTEPFTNKRKKVYQDFSSRFSLMPTEYAAAL